MSDEKVESGVTAQDWVEAIESLAEMQRNGDTRAAGMLGDALMVPLLLIVHELEESRKELEAIRAALEKSGRKGRGRRT